MIGHESRAAGVLELHLGRVDDPAGTHRSGFGGSPTSLTGLLCISAAGTCISEEQMKLQSLRKPQQALSSWRTSFPPGPPGGTAQLGTYQEFQEVSGEL